MKAILGSEKDNLKIIQNLILLKLCVQDKIKKRKMAKFDLKFH